MGFCFRPSSSTKTLGGKGQGERGRVPIAAFVYPFPFTLYPLPFTPIPLIPLVLLDIVSVNPRAAFLFVASLKENVLTIFASHQVHARINILI